MTVADINIVVGQGGSGSLDNLGLTFGSAGGVQTLQTKDSSGTQKLGSSLPLSASTYYGDGSNLTGVAASNASSLRLNGADAVVATNITASNDVILVDTSAGRIIEMPDITSGDVGQITSLKTLLVQDPQIQSKLESLIQITILTVQRVLKSNLIMVL